MNTSSTTNVLADPADRLSSDIAVIGSGPGGSITACLLAEAGRDVLLIEDGAFLPLHSCEPFSRDEMVQKYRNGGLTAALGRTKIAYVEAQTVGGGSEINSGLYHRTPPEVLEHWRREFEVAELHEEDLVPHFEACEKDLSVSLLPGPAHAFSRKLHESALRLGWHSLEVPRWFKYQGQSGSDGQPKGERQSMTETYIPRALRAGCKLVPNTRVRFIRRFGSKWIARGFQHCGMSSGKRPIEIQANTLFLCGGAIQTPAVLRRSGFRHNVGNTLRMHPTVKVVARFAEEVTDAETRVPVHQVKEFAPRFSFGASVSSPSLVALAMLDHAGYQHEARSDWPNLAVYYVMIVGTGSGTVRSLPFYSDPLVRYTVTDQDLHDLADGVRKLCLALLNAGAQAIYPSVVGLPRITSESELSAIPHGLPASRTNLMTIHLFSSCPMGDRKARCATDSFGRVHDTVNLYVNDASLLCTAPGVNPQGSIMAIARRNVQHFLGSI